VPLPSVAPPSASTSRASRPTTGLVRFGGSLYGGVGGNFSECGFQFDAKLCGGPVCVKATSDGDVTMQADSYEFGVGCDAKLAGEVCGKW